MYICWFTILYHHQPTDIHLQSARIFISYVCILGISGFIMLKLAGAIHHQPTAIHLQSARIFISYVCILGISGSIMLKLAGAIQQYLCGALPQSSKRKMCKFRGNQRQHSSCSFCLVDACTNGMPTIINLTSKKKKNDWMPGLMSARKKLFGSVVHRLSYPFSHNDFNVSRARLSPFFPQAQLSAKVGQTDP